jgi:hypothetical protein
MRHFEVFDHVHSRDAKQTPTGGRMKSAAYRSGDSFSSNSAMKPQAPTLKTQTAQALSSKRVSLLALRKIGRSRSNTKNTATGRPNRSSHPIGLTSRKPLETTPTQANQQMSEAPRSAILKRRVFSVSHRSGLNWFINFGENEDTKYSIDGKFSMRPGNNVLFSWAQLPECAGKVGWELSWGWGGLGCGFL